MQGDYILTHPFTIPHTTQGPIASLSFTFQSLLPIYSDPKTTYLMLVMRVELKSSRRAIMESCGM